MKRTRALPSVLDVLDDGLRLYRRNLSGFTLVATAVLVVLALLALGWMAFVRTQIGVTSGWMAFGIFLLALIGYPLVLYAFAALSRATAAALDGQPITLPGALGLGPARGCGMVLFNLLFSMIAAVGASIISTVVSCPITYATLIGATVLARLASSTGFAASIIPFSVIFPLSSLWSLTMLGAWLASIVFALQAFVLERRPWGQAAGRSIDLLAGRFGQSVLMFIGAGAIFSTLIVSYLGSLIVLFVLVNDRLGLDLPPLAQDVIIIVLTVASLVVLLPPLSIWMAMFYRQIAVERDGMELSALVAAWQQRIARVSA